MKGKIIEAQNLTKKYGDFTAVDDISFSVEKGEVFGLLGPNGAGKTTTINMLIGMAKISAGKVFYDGVDLTKSIKKAQEIIGVVADESNLYDEMSGYDNLCFCGSLYGLSKEERETKAKDLLNTFQLNEAANKKFRAYSKGMKRKLTIAAALIHKPQVLFLDEPTSGIDVASARQIRDLIKELNKKGATVFLTTHYIEEVFGGIVAISILFGTTSMLSVTITFERKSRSFERLLLAPLRMELLIMAKIAGAILFGIFNSIIPVLFSVLYFKAVVTSWTMLITGIILLSIISTLLGLFISVSAKEVFEAQTYSNFYRFPMIFLCGLFIPVAALPVFIQPLSYLLPVTYGVDIIKYSITGTNTISLFLDLALLIFFCFFLFYFSLFFIRKKWIV